jgi:hypothetical protein
MDINDTEKEEKDNGKLSKCVKQTVRGNDEKGAFQEPNLSVNDLRNS